MRSFVVGALVLVLIGLGIFMFYVRRSDVPALPDVLLPGGTVTIVEQTIATPEITFSYPETFGLAVTQEQVLASSYIPPCEPGFDYCLYYHGKAYEGTNFDSAGLRVKRRGDLTSVDTCLTTSPEGYENLEPTMQEMDTYSVSMFAPLGDAGAGHYARGALYRLSVGSACFEFQTRVGESQYANYEPGTIEEFTESDRAEVTRSLQGILQSVILTESKEKVIFPK